MTPEEKANLEKAKKLHNQIMSVLDVWIMENLSGEVNSDEYVANFGILMGSLTMVMASCTCSSFTDHFKDGAPLNSAGIFVDGCFQNMGYQGSMIAKKMIAESCKEESNG